jgi:hypothetical protein
VSQIDISLLLVSIIGAFIYFSVRKNDSLLTDIRDELRKLRTTIEQIPEIRAQKEAQEQANKREVDRLVEGIAKEQKEAKARAARN